MANYGLHDLNNVGTVIRYKEFSTPPINPAGKNWEWLLVVETQPAYNDALEIQTGPIVVVTTGINITHTWTNTAKSPAQIDAERDAKTAAAMDDKLQRAIKSLGLVIADNTPLSPQDVRDQFRAHYKQLLINEGE